MTLYWLAFLIGIGGSIHCVGMCGPIALAIPVKNLRFNAVLINRLLYNLGRIATYGTMGFFIGALGFGAQLAGIQKYLSVLLGACLILYIIFSAGRFQLLSHFKVFNSWLVKIKLLFSRKMSTPGKRNNFLIGMLNGLLPCGLVYVALVNSLLVSSPWEGFIFMAVFGLGTLPALFILPFATGIFKFRPLANVKKFVPVLIFGLGVFLIIRGINFDNPFFTATGEIISRCLP